MKQILRPGRGIRCAACQDPYGEVDTNLTAYDSKCTDHQIRIVRVGDPYPD